ncbi:MAG: DNA repair protein RadA [Myxococcales bacterium FL481]|nr:MAG: DNA repair protein RadA [Myxococcales bacterium FL481]
MAKNRSRWVCSACGAETRGWFGQCPHCGAWNTIAEQASAPAPGRVSLAPAEGQVVSAADAQADAEAARRLTTGIGEFDRVLGGGLVPGSVVLLGGPPGIGKSTLLLQACAGLCRSGHRVLYASGEESVAQVAARAGRLQAREEELLLLAQTRLEPVLERVDEHRPAVLVIDSIQTIYSEAQDGLPGNVTQIRSVASRLVSLAKTAHVPVLIVGHVTKDGQIAGPRLLEHMVDAVLAFDGDEERATRMLRATKNRFGSTQELGVFEMTGDGLREIANPSEAFLAERPGDAIGSCVTACLEGSRPLLLEIQALLGQSPGGSPRRTCVGADPSRLAMLLAVLERHGDLFVLDQDVFVNITGGIRVTEPAVDLAVLLAVASSHLRKPLSSQTLAVGEVGLTGELRRVPRAEARFAEAQRLGFRQVLCPPSRGSGTLKGLKTVEVGSVAQAIDVAFAR